MFSMQGFVFLEEIIMNNGLPVIYDYMMTRRSLAVAVTQELTISVAIDFSYNLLIQTNVESQVYNTTTTNSYIQFKPILIVIFVSFKRNKSIYKYFRNLKIFTRILKSCSEC